MKSTLVTILLSTLAALSSTLIGYLVASHLRLLINIQRMRWLSCWGSGLVVAGLLWHIVWPLNKALWTGSYVLFSSGLILLLLALLVYLLDIKPQRWLQPLVVYGTNPLFIYMLSWLWVICASQYLVWQYDGAALSLYQAGFNSLAAVLSPRLASLLFALLHVALFWMLSQWLYKRKIFIRL